MGREGWGSEIQSYKTELQTRVTHYDVISRVTLWIFYIFYFLELLTLVGKQKKIFELITLVGKKNVTNSVKRKYTLFLNYYNSDYVIKQQFFLKIYIYTEADPEKKKGYEDRKIFFIGKWHVDKRTNI